MWALGLLAAVAAPLLAHLLSRQRGRPALFPAARFVARAVADMAQLQRPRHRLLMLLRMALLALVIAAFTRPVWSVDARLLPDEGLRVVMLLDRSASMSRIEQGGSLLQEAVRQIDAALAGLDPQRDRAGVVCVDADPMPLLPELTGHFDLLRRQLATVKPSHQRGNLAQAVQVALQPLQREHGKEARPVAAVHLHLYSDMQATQWPGESWLRELAQQGVVLHLHRVGRPTDNAFVRQARVTPAAPVLGQPVQIRAEVGHFASQRRDMVVRFEHGDGAVRVPVTLPPSGAAMVQIDWQPREAGFAVVRVSLEEREALSVDDATAVGFTVASTRPVQLLSGGDAGDAWQGTFYVARALDPLADAGGSEGNPRHVVSARPPREGLLQPDPAAHQHVLVEAGALDDAALGALARRLDAGDGVVWVIDSAASADALARFAASPAGVRWAVLEPRQWRQQQSAKVAAAADHPILRLFEGPSRAALLQASFTQTLESRLADGAVALLTLDDGSPLLALRPGEQGGGLAVLGADLSPRGSDLAKGPLLLPLLHETLRGLSPQPPPMPLAHPGQRPTIPLPGRWRASDLSVLGPGDQTVAIHAMVDHPRGTDLVLDVTPTAGFYRVVRHADGRPLAGFSVEPDPLESDLSATADEPASTPGATAVVAATGLRPVQVELWPWCLALAALALAFEPILIAWLQRDASPAAQRGGDAS
jgi:hypothetical protein